MNDDFQQECQRYVDNIKNELERRFAGNDDEIEELQERLDDLMFEEPEMPDQEDDESDEDYDKKYAEYEKAHDEWDRKTDKLQAKIDELEDEGDLRSYFDDYLDVDFIVNSSKEYQSARIWVTLGGPGVYIDTEDSAVKLNWGSNHAEAYLSYDLRNAIDEIFEEIYDNS